MRRHYRRCTMLIAAVLLFTLTLVGRNVTAAHAAARSTYVTLVNWSSCDLTRTAYWLDHGEWTYIPPDVIPYNYQGQWESESNGILTGTEGHARFRTSDCDNRADKGKFIEVHWDNPYVGSNSYDSIGSDWAFLVTYSGGTGNNASVTFTLTPPGVAPITRTMTTDGQGQARWRTAIPKGAALGRGVAAALVHTQDFGDTTTQTFITINK